MPAYWFSIAVVLFVVIFQKLTTGTNSVTILPKDFVSTSATLTLLTYPFSTFPTINWVYWSLTYELFFYLIVTLSLCFSKYFRLPFLLFISILALVIPVVQQGPLFFLNQWPAFVLGVGVYLLYNKQDFKQIFFAILLIAISFITLTKNFFWSGQIAYCIAAIIATLLIMLSHHIKIKNNPFSKLGDYSYAVYLIHVPVGCYLIGAFKNPAIQKNIFLNISFDLFTYILISCLSFLIFEYIESPCIQAGKLFSKKYFTNTKSNKKSILIPIDTIPH